jgi:hypothetical protein
MYRGTDLFSMKGMEHFVRDGSEVLEELQRRALGLRLFAQKPADLF